MATAAIALGIVETESGGGPKAATGSEPDKPHAKPKKTDGLGDARPATQATTVVDGVRLPTSPYIVAENAKTGHAWWVTTPQTDRGIEGYADQVSAVIGDTITLFVSTKATRFHVEAYRMGYYQGIGGRLVWASGERPGVRQPPTRAHLGHQYHRVPVGAVADHHHRSELATGRLPVETGRLHRRAAVRALLRARRHLAGGHRHPAQRDDLAGLQPLGRVQPLLRQRPAGRCRSPTTPRGGTFDDRARVVSFDRPYDYDWASGAADFVGNELPVIYQAEQLGLDVTYWTDVDLHANPQLLLNHRALISLGHDEYWSAPMRDGAAHVVGQGCEPGLPRGQRVLPADPLRAVTARRQPTPGVLQVGGRRSDDRRGSRAGHGQLATSAGVPSGGRADRQHLPGHRSPGRHGDHRSDLMGVRRARLRTPTTCCPAWSRASSTVTSRAVADPPTWT